MAKSIRLTGSTTMMNNPVLIWENPNPQQEFESQSIYDSNINKYSLFYVIFLDTDTPNQYIFSTTVLKGGAAHICQGVIWRGSNNLRISRTVAITDNINFGYGFKYTSVSGGEQDNHVAIPYRVYAIA